MLARVEALDVEPGETFTLEEMYGFEEELSRRWPENQHVRAKIRQQLQVLRDEGVVKFLGGGEYRVE